MREQAEQRVRRQRIAPFEIEHREHDYRRDGKNADRQMEVDQYGDCNAQKRRMGDGFAEIGEPPPDDEAPRRSGDKGQSDTGEHSANEEVVQHGSARCRLVMLVGHQDDHVVSGRHRPLQIVGDQEDPASEIAANSLDQRVDHIRARNIDALGRLVQDQKIRAVDQRPGQQEPLEFAARQGGHPADRRGVRGQRRRAPRSISRAGKRPVRVIRRRSERGRLGPTAKRCGT